MKDHLKKIPELSSVRGEIRVLNISVFLMIVFGALNYLAIFRLIGVSGLSSTLLVLYRVLDLIIILAFLIYCGGRVKFRVIDLLLIIFISYPFIIGIAKENISITFVHDSIIFLFFIIKIIVFRTVLCRILSVIDLDSIFRKPAFRIVFWSATIALVSLLTVFILLRQGTSFYYQAHAEITFAAALLLAKGKIFAFLFFLLLALIGGKRMVMVGLIIMGLTAVFNNARVRSAIFRSLPVVALFFPIAFILGYTFLNTDMVFVDKIQSSFRVFSSALAMSDKFFEVIMFIDPVRFSEYVSLKPHLTGWSLWFGNGYGFRYELDSDFLFDHGYTEEFGDVTNAHFTPLAITSKFGLIGLLIWVTLVTSVLTARCDRKSYLQYAGKLAFLSMLVQSFFAFSFFINFFTPIYIALATTGKMRIASDRNIPLIVNQKQVSE